MISLWRFIIPLAVWLFCMRDFLFGQIPVNMDTLTIYAVAKFYFNNLLNGTVPLWDPFVSLGAPFYAITLCNLFSPIALLMPLTALLSGDFYAGFLIYMVSFFILGAWGFYLLAKELIKDKQIAYLAYVLLIFSSLGASMFTQFTLLELFVPAVWFFYFLLRFFAKPSIANCLGLCFATMSVLIAYVPFYFLTLFVFFLCTLRLAWYKEFANKAIDFVKAYKMLVALCLLAVLISALPLMVYKAIDARGDIVSPGRHCQYTSAQECVAKTINEQGGMSFKEITQSGTLSERMDLSGLVKHLDKISYGTDAFIVIPFLILVIFIFALPLGVNRLMLGLWALIALLLMVALGAQTPLYGILYKALPWMKFFRNLFFFIAYLIPLIILVACLQLKDILRLGKNAGFDKWLGVATLGIVLGLWLLDDVLPSMYVTVMLAGAILLFARGKRWVMAALTVVAMLMPLQVFAHYVKGAGIFAYPISQAGVTPQFNFIRPAVAPASEARIFRFVPYENFAATMLMQDTTPKIGYPNSVPRDAFLLAQHKGEAFIASLARHKLYWVPQGGEPMALDKDNPLVQVKRFSPNELVVTGNFQTPGRLVYTDNHASFWRAYIDGESVPVIKAADAFKAVDVQEGLHEIAFKYVPLGGQAVYVVVTFVFMLMFLGVVIAYRKTTAAWGTVPQYVSQPVIANEVKQSKLFNRNIFLYFCLFAVLVGTVDYRQTQMNRLHYLLGIFYNDHFTNFKDGVTYFDLKAMVDGGQAKHKVNLAYAYSQLGDQRRYKNIVTHLPEDAKEQLNLLISGRQQLLIEMLPGEAR